MTDLPPSTATSPSLSPLPQSVAGLAYPASPLETLPPWLDKSLPWLVSGTLHFGLLLVAIFVWYLARNALTMDDRDQIIIPTSFTDPSFSATPGPPSPGTGGDPSRAAAQAKLKDLMKA